MFPFLKHKFGATFVVSLFTAAAITSCCMGSYKCKGDDLDLRFRLLSSTGNDLLFGPGRIYDSRLVRFYSLRGTDTVFHQSIPGANPQPGGDSILYLDIEPVEKLFVKWNNTDSDSITLQLSKIDASPCCPDYTDVEFLRFGTSPPQKEGDWGVIELRK